MDKSMISTYLGAEGQLRAETIMNRWIERKIEPLLYPHLQLWGIPVFLTRDMPVDQVGIKVIWR